MSSVRARGHNMSQRRFSAPKAKGRGVTLNVMHPAHRAGRSIFPSRVFDVDEVVRVLKSGHQSAKIGKVVAKGHLRGAPIFTLTLEERATCPRTCAAWAYCYGNNMQAAERIVAGPVLEAALWHELGALQAMFPAGFLVRLHVLGDFYSLAYVDLWRRALDEFPALYVFGFTARQIGTVIGDAIVAIATAEWRRFAVRVSGLAADRGGALVVDGVAGGIGVSCPAQNDLTDCCATCALCWQSDVTIQFRRH